ncbi:hypothetical protein A3K63_04415 [Candidatus Micrarchaeota archaeon RBG_16_49_10]|nr:MAG: hypothetical protein A3K63_04415 [Candidatus Micrarchaeota archaeon RBG_16_49_10]
MGEMNARRTKTQIYVDILRSLQRSNGRLRKTHIVYKANLTHTRLEEYLEFLLARKFIEEDGNGRQVFYKITEKGMRFLEQVTRLREISDAFGVSLY